MEGLKFAKRTVFIGRNIEVKCGHGESTVCKGESILVVPWEDILKVAQQSLDDNQAIDRAEVCSLGIRVVVREDC